MQPAARTRRVALLVLVLLACAAASLPATSAGAGPYVPSGRPVTAGPDAGSATPLQPGRYLTVLRRGGTATGGSGSTAYFAITVPTGRSPYVAATGVLPDGAAESDALTLSVRMTGRGQTSTCADESGSDYASDGHLPSVTTVAAPGPAGSEDACPAGTVVVAVERSGEALADRPLRVELAYRLEPAAVATTGLPGAASTPQRSLQPQLSGPAASIASGDDFAGSPLLADGIYRDVLRPGDTRIVRIHLEWGQRFAYSYSSAPVRGVDDSFTVSATVRNPVRQLAPQQNGLDSSSAYSVGSDDASLSGATLVPVRYANRRSDVSGVDRYAVAGDYYLVLSADEPDSGDPRVPYSLQVQVFGRAGGAPSYAAASGSTPPPADDDGRRGAAIAVASGAAVLLAVIALVARLGRRRRHG